MSNSGSAHEFIVEIANEPEAHAQGLMFRTVLPEGHGMLFVFPAESPRSFWMKNTLIPLDIVFFSDAGGYVSDRTMTPCAADPCPTYPSGAPARYALELPAGTVERLGIGPGWKLQRE